MRTSLFIVATFALANMVHAAPLETQLAQLDSDLQLNISCQPVATTDITTSKGLWGVKTTAGVKYKQMQENYADELIEVLEYKYHVVSMLRPGHAKYDDLPGLMKGTMGFLAQQGLDVLLKYEAQKAL